MQPRPGDWIIEGVKGEIYPCKQDIFRSSLRGLVRARRCKDRSIDLSPPCSMFRPMPTPRHSIPSTTTSSRGSRRATTCCATCSASAFTEPGSGGWRGALRPSGGTACSMSRPAPATLRSASSEISAARRGGAASSPTSARPCWRSPNGAQARLPAPCSSRSTMRITCTRSQARASISIRCRSA